MGSSNFSSTHSFLWKGKSQTAIVTIGIDLAKNVFAVYCIDATGKPVLVRPSVPRTKLLELTRFAIALPHRFGSLLRRSFDPHYCGCRIPGPAANW